MQPGAEITDHGGHVKRHRPVLDSQSGSGAPGGITSGLRAVRNLKEKPAGLSGVQRDPGAAGVERPDPTDHSISGPVGVAADDDVGVAPRQQAAEHVVGDAGLDPWAGVRARRGVYAEHARPVGQTQAQLTRQARQDSQQARLAQDAAGPADPGRHQAVTFHQVDAAGRVGGGGMRSGLLAGQDITIGVPLQHLNTRQRLEKLQHLGRTRTRQDQVAHDPPPVHLTAGRVIKHRPQRDFVPVYVGQDAKPHGSKRIFARPELRI